MAPLTTSAPIQAFFPPAKKDHLSSSEIGDGFTADELNSVISPQVNGPWSPATDYREVEIVYIDPGPRCITFKGRIANLYDQTSGSKKPKAAKGCVRFVVKDDTGCITVCPLFRSESRECRECADELTGQTMVCELGVFTPSGTDRHGMDSTCLEWRAWCVDGVFCAVVY